MLPADLFVSDAAHEKTISLPDGSEHVFRFREFSAAEYRRVQKMATSDDEDKREQHRAFLVSMTLVDDSGALVLTEAQAAKLKPAVLDRMYVAALEVNGYGGKAQPPGEPNGSGTS